MKGECHARKGLALVGTYRAACFVALACYSGIGQAQLRIEPYVSGELRWTNNANYGGAGDERDDLVLTLTPGVGIRHVGPRLNIDGDFTLGVSTYLNGEGTDQVTPRGSVRAVLEAVQDFFFVESSFTASTIVEDPFGVRPQAGSTANTGTALQFQLNPYVQGRLSDLLTYRIRSENGWTDTTGTGSDTRGTYTGHHSISVNRDPTPLGYFISAETDETRAEGDTEPVLREDSVRVGALYAVSAQLTLGLRGGYERIRGLLGEEEHSIYGASVAWSPSPRTSLNAVWEERYFGSGWLVNLSHRMPRLAFSVHSSRDSSTSSEALLRLPPTNNVSALLNAILTTRYPDPAARSDAVQQIISSQGLPPSLQTFTLLFTTRAQLLTMNSASAVYLGARNSLGLTVFEWESRDLASEISTVVDPSRSIVDNNKTLGTALTFSHRLTERTAFNATTTWSRTRGLDENSSQTSRQWSQDVSLSHRLALRTDVYTGARYTKFDSDVNTDSREYSVYVGFNHRFY